MKNPSVISLLSILTLLALAPVALSAQDAASDGSLTWSYPIQVPPGRNGIGPSLSINYNSFGGNSFLGMGMQLGGLSAITRDQSYGIKFDADDHFLLDGQKLVFITEVNGVRRYRPERETYQKIECQGDPNASSGSYWVVTAKNGTRFYYGYDDDNHEETDDGRIDAVGKGGQALVWCLSRVVDVHGNYYVIKYLEDTADGDYYPRKIAYTRNELVGGITKVHAIEFSYETRTGDSTVLYIPTRFQMDRRLKWITVKTGCDPSDVGSLVRKYRFDYENGASTSRSRLIAIQEYGTDGTIPPSPDVGTYTPTGTALPATTLYWSNADVFDTYTEWTSNTLKTINLVGDYNGDGLADILQPVSEGWRILFSTGTAFSADTSVQYGYKEGNGTGDFNGDGMTDHIQYVDDSGWRVNLSDGSSADGTPVLICGTPWSIAGKKYCNADADFTGDGRTDHIQWADSPDYWRVFESTGENSFTTKSWSTAGEKAYNNNADFNGDGKTDHLQYDSSSNKWRVFISKGDSFDVQLNWLSTGVCDAYTLGDFNGDGKTDLLFSKLNYSGFYDWRVYLSNGTAFSSADVPDYAMLSSVYTSAIPGDFNGDGKTDIIFYDGRSGSGTGKVFLSTGISFVDGNKEPGLGPLGDFDGDGQTDIVVSPSGDCRVYRTSHPADLLIVVSNGRGGTATITYKPVGQFSGAANSIGKSYPYIANTRPRNLVANIKFDNGFGPSDPNNQGNSISFDYKDGMVKNGTLEKRKNFGFRTVERRDDNTKVYTLTTYRQPVAGENGVEDPNECLAGMVKKVEVKKRVNPDLTDPENDIPYTETTYDYGWSPVVNAPAEVKFIYKIKEQVKNFDGNAIDPDEYEVVYIDEQNSNAPCYDAYGNLTKVTNKGRLGNDFDQTIVETEWLVNPALNLCVPKWTKRFAYKLDDTLGLASETRYVYDNLQYEDIPSKGLVTRIEYENGPEDSSVLFEYDNYGNLFRTKDPKAVRQGGGYTSTLEFDTAFRAFLIKATNAMGHYGEIIYDDLMRPRETRTEAGVADTNSSFTLYDVFSRPIKSIFPGDQISGSDQSSNSHPTTKMSYKDTLTTNAYHTVFYPPYVKTESREHDTEYLTSFRYLDGLGRVIQTKAESTNSQWATVDYYYDKSGRAYKQSAPYVTTTSEYSNPDQTRPYKEIQYDDISRVKRAFNTDGSGKSNEYNRRSVTSYDENSNHYETVRDGNTSTVTYYNVPNHDQPFYAELCTTTTKSCWNGTKIIDNEQNMIETNVLDLLGRLTSYSDPDMGAWSYHFDENLNLTAQTDAKGQTVTLEYDVLNRPVVERHGGEVKVRYYYDGNDETGGPYYGEDKYGASCRGRLTKKIWYKELETGGVFAGSEAYKYDARGRIVRSTVKIGTIEKTEDFEYDSMNRVTNQRLPVGTNGISGREELNAGYGADGNLTGITSNRITNPDQQYAHDLHYMIYGKLKQIVYGNSVKTTYNYYDNIDTNGNTIDEPDGLTRMNSYRLRDINIKDANGTVITDTRYNYDGVGNVTQQIITNGQETLFSEHYEYDNQNRIKTTLSWGLYGMDVYDYDSLNNITLKTNKHDGYDYIWGYSYVAHVTGRANKLPHAVSSINWYGNQVHTFSYDQNGNMTRETGVTKIEIRAKRSAGNLKAPVMELWANNERQTGWEVKDTEYTTYKWSGSWAGLANINIAFRNGDGPDQEVSDLSVDSIKVNGNVFQVEESAGFAVCSYDDFCDGDIGDVWQSGIETFSCSGALYFFGIYKTTAKPLVRDIGYDMLNRVTHVTESNDVLTINDTSNYEYDPSGRRVKKEEAGVTTYYFFANYELEVTGTQETQKVHYFANGQRVAQRKIVSVNGAIQSESLLYIHSDHLGSAVRLTDTTGNLIQSLLYDPFGVTTYSSGMNEPEDQFTGQKKDGTWLYYYGARYYVPELMRFISPDTVLAGLNRYAYCGNNPVNYVDPTGHSPRALGEGKSGVNPYETIGSSDPGNSKANTTANTQKSTQATPEKASGGNGDSAITCVPSEEGQQASSGGKVKTEPAPGNPDYDENGARRESGPGQVGALPPPFKQMGVYMYPYYPDNKVQVAIAYDDFDEFNMFSSRREIDATGCDLWDQFRASLFCWDNFFKFFWNSIYQIAYQVDQSPKKLGLTDMSVLEMAAIGNAGGISFSNNLRVAGTLSKASTRQLLLGMVHTGRAVAVNLVEKLALEQAMASPEVGEVLERVIMNDPRFPASEGWIKMNQTINGVQIHYLMNSVSRFFTDFKIVN